MKFKQCSRCLMDESADSITFNEIGHCNYCIDFQNTKNLSLKSKIKYDLKELISELKNNKKNYDCVVGVSGGVDSSYVLVKCVELGLKPLAVHMDNGWNSSLAQNNISKIVKKLNIDLITYVIHWKEYRSLMNSFFNADVIDIELLMDHAMLAVNYKIAHKYKIKNIIAGSNQSTEGFEMPNNWVWFKYDKRNIKTINKKFENYKLKTYPFLSIYKYIYLRFFKKYKWIPLLDYFDYKKKEALNYLKENFDFIPYPYKHYESVFTRFYQGFILPKKFGVDKRKIHLSNLILTNQISRIEASKIMKNDPYYSKLELRNDTDFFLKKMQWTKEKLFDYLNRREIKHDFYSNDFIIWKKLRLFKNIIKKKNNSKIIHR